MIPNIGANGSSFRGAGAYYLHDKATDAAMPKELKPKTTDRVGWIETRNLANDDMAAALDEMWKTAFDAPHLKEMAGHKAGRPLTKPVKTISLSWHPDQQPTREDKVQAADAFLAHMGWQEHQAVIIEHTDTKHAHIHIILNRVHPDSGLTLNDSLEQRRAQKWAHAYELEHGQVWCVERDKKYGRDGDPQHNSPGHPHDYAPAAKQAQATFIAAEDKLATHDRRHERDQLSERHQAERDEFFATNKAYVKAIRNEVYRQVGDEWRETWRDHYQFVKDVRGEARSLAAQEHLLASAAVREHNFDRARAALDTRDAVIAYAEDTIKMDRAALRADQRADTKERQNEAAAAFIGERYSQYDELRERQKNERHELKALQTAREAGRPYDADRLESLLAPHQPKSEPDAQTPQRIAEILATMDKRYRGLSTGTDPMSKYDPVIEDGTREDERRRNMAELAQRKNDAEHLATTRDIDTLISDRRADDQAKLQEIGKAFTDLSRDSSRTGMTPDIERRAQVDHQPGRDYSALHEQQKATQARLDAFAREQEDSAARAKEIATIADQQKTDGREASERADASYTRSADDRWAQALGRYFDPSQPYRSMAAAVAHEHELFLKERDDLRHQIGQEKDTDKRQLLQLREQAEGYEYAAHLANRSGQLSEIVTGRSAETAQERAQREATQDPALRAALDKANRADRVSEAQLAATTGQQGNVEARADYEVRDKLKAQAAEAREKMKAKMREMEVRQFDQGRAAAAASDQQRAHSQETQADRTLAASNFSAATKAAIDARRERAGFTTASREGSKARETDSPERPAREDGVSRNTAKQREQDGSRDR